MGLLNKLSQQGSSLTHLNGATPPIPNLQGSKLHKTYSINGDPNIPNLPSPSQLDLNGVTPEKYLDRGGIL